MSPTDGRTISALLTRVKAASLLFSWSPLVSRSALKCADARLEVVEVIGVRVYPFVKAVSLRAGCVHLSAHGLHLSHIVYKALDGPLEVDERVPSLTGLAAA
jgi:hypothetical protein